MASNLLRFSNETQSNGRQLFWGRADVDGLPYRGEAPPYTEDEYDNRVVRVADAHNNFFDVTDQEQNKRYLEIIERCHNGWYQLLCLERFWHQTTAHYVEWLEYYLEDGSRTPYGPGRVMEVPRGFRDSPGDLAQGP